MARFKSKKRERENQREAIWRIWIDSVWVESFCERIIWEQLSFTVTVKKSGDSMDPLLQKGLRQPAEWGMERMQITDRHNRSHAL